METGGDDLSTTIVVQHVVDTNCMYRATLLGWRREMAAILHLYNAALLSTCVANPRILEDEDSTLTKSENNFGECHPFLVCYCQGSTCCFSVSVAIFTREISCVRPSHLRFVVLPVEIWWKERSKQRVFSLLDMFACEIVLRNSCSSISPASAEPSDGIVVSEDAVECHAVHLRRQLGVHRARASHVLRVPDQRR